MKLLYIYITLFSVMSFSFADVINVPADQSTIQAGINAAIDGDTVLVAENTYYENINFKGKAITVASHFILDQDTSHISRTIIDGSQPSDPNKGSVVSFTSGEDTTSILCGFTITGGTGTLVNGTVMEGGGILIRYAAARICHNIIENNTAVSTIERAFGGGICALPEYTIIENNIIRNNLLQSSAGNAWGGGIYLQTASRITNNTITQNEVSYSGSSADFLSVGGGTACYGYGATIELEFSDNIISENYCKSTAWAYGGGSYFLNSKVDFTGNTLSGNRTNGANNKGCGMYMIHFLEVNPKSGSIIKNNNFLGNKTEGDLYSEGGGLCLYYTDGIDIVGNQFEGNKSFYGGGLFEVSSENTTISENAFRKNSALSGGGMMVVESKETTISENKIVSNTITDNNGGGLSIQDSPDTKLIKNLIKGNTAVSSSGGGLEIVTTQPDSVYKTWLINNTICENTALRGGGLYSEFAYLTIKNTIFWDDSAETNNEIYYAGNSINVSYSDVQDSLWSGPGNIQSDPDFTDSLCHLGGGSLCIDAGNPDPDYYDEDGSRNDMGVYGGITDSLIRTITGLFGIDSKQNIPDHFVLSQNYPNPFNPTTTIEFQIPQVQLVLLKIYNVLGQEVATLVSEKLLPGRYRYEWDASGFASGVYFYRFTTENGLTLSKKLVLLK